MGDSKPNGDKIKEILENWKYNGIKISEQIKTNNMKLVYPILLVYGSNNGSYESNIIKVENYIKNNYQNFQCNLDLSHSIFFILLPLAVYTSPPTLRYIGITQDNLDDIYLSLDL